jgi:hypothetical protein
MAVVRPVVVGAELFEDGQRRAFGGQVEVFPAEGQDLTDTGAGGEHDVDDVAGVPRSGLAGDGLLPVADRGADGSPNAAGSTVATCG